MEEAPAWLEYLRHPPETVRLSYGVHGQYVDRENFLLKDAWAMHFHNYEGELWAGEGCFALHAGAVSLVPPGQLFTYVYRGRSEHLYVHFKMRAPVPAPPVRARFFPAERRLDALQERLAEVVGYRDGDFARTDARLWDVLWGLAQVESFPRARTAHMELVDRAARICQQEMAHCPGVAELARRCGLSHSQFIRVLKAHTGLTPQAWLRKLRTDRARELLLHSDLPVKVVACEVGLADLQHFNKLMRRTFGCSPRHLRETGG